MKRITSLFILLLFSLLLQAGLSDGENRQYIQAGHQSVVEKIVFKKRFGDTTTNGRFAVYKMDFINKDTVEHAIDYSCFYLTDGSGVKYEVHSEATIIRQTRNEDFYWRATDVLGFKNKRVKPNMKLSGFLVFEVPAEAVYKLNFRGYLK